MIRQLHANANANMNANKNKNTNDEDYNETRDDEETKVCMPNDHSKQDPHN